MSKDLESLEREIDEYRSSQGPKTEVDPNKPNELVVSAPVHISSGRFFDPANLPDKLPPISHRKYEFAVEFAYSHKSISKFAETYGVTENTIYTWLSDERVRTYIASFRFDARMHYLSNWMSMEREAVEAVQRILRMRLSSSTAPVIGQTARYVLDYMSRVRGGPAVGGSPDDEGAYTGGEGNKFYDQKKGEESEEDLQRQIQEIDSEIANLEVWEENLSDEQ